MYCFIRTQWERCVEPSLPLSLFASRKQWIDVVILWCSGKKCFMPWFSFLCDGSLWQPCSQYQSKENYSISTLNITALHLNIRTAAVTGFSRLLAEISCVPCITVVCQLVLQRVNVLTLTPEASHFFQESLIAPELALCLLYAPWITYSSALEQCVSKHSNQVIMEV